MFVIGGPAWRSRADRLITESGGAAINACDLPILHAAALLERSDIFVGPDSGPLNIAAAVGTPAYGLFGITPALDYSRHIHMIRATPDPSTRTPMAQLTPARAVSVILPALAEVVSRPT